jgi:alkane 1-monooxygenase
MEGVLKPGAAQLSVVARVTTWPLIGLLTLPVIGWALGGGLWHWLTLMVFVAMSVLDPFVGPDNINHRPEDEIALEKSLFYRAMLWLLVPAQWAVAVFCYWLFTQGDLSAAEQAGVLLSSAIAVGFGATAAHELAHHGQRFDRWMGILLFTPINMCDFAIYHNYGHHNRVATPEDPGSAKYGDSIFAFIVTSIVFKTLMGWGIEAERLRRQGRSPWSLRNGMLWMTVLPLAWLAVMVGLFGWLAVPLFLAHFLFARVLLAVADYLEHYGLARRRLSDGSWETIRAAHAWDDSFLVSSLLFCQIDRHSDHHANVGRPYQILRVMPEAPRLPYGYLVMLWVALIPPLWRKVMHPRVQAVWDTGAALPHGRPENLPERYRQDAVY